MLVEEKIALIVKALELVAAKSGRDPELQVILSQLKK